jgi:hypothetical protein
MSDEMGRTCNSRMITNNKGGMTCNKRPSAVSTKYTSTRKEKLRKPTKSASGMQNKSTIARHDNARTGYADMLLK